MTFYEEAVAFPHFPYYPDKEKNKYNQNPLQHCVIII